MQDETTSDEARQQLRHKAEQFLNDHNPPLPEGKDLQELLHELRVHQAELEVQNAQLREAQVQLEESRQRYYYLFDLAPIGYVLLDQELLVVEINLAGAEMFSTNRKGITAKPFLLRICPEDHEVFLQHRQQVMASDGCLSCELKMRRQDGTTFWARLQSTRLQVGPNSENCLTTLVDIDEARRARQELADSESRYRLIFETAGVMIFTLDMHGRIRVCNQRAAAVLGLPHETILGQRLSNFIDEEDRSTLQSRIRQSLAADVHDAEFRLLDQAGQTHIVNANFTSMVPESQAQHVVLCVMEDITHRRELERRLHQAETMEAIGRLAGGVAHDFRNQLTVVKGYCELLLNQYPADAHSELHESLEQIRHAADKAASTTSQLLAFSRKRDLAPETLDLNDVLSTLAEPLRRILGEDVDVIVKPAEDLPAVTCERGQLEQAILNLAGNAREAMPSGGRLVLATTTVELQQPRNGDGTELPPGTYVQLTVRDTGMGIREENARHIFEPFFTTKEETEGTGLGLAVVYGFARRSGGGVTVQSQPGQGSTFHILLPAAQGHTARHQAETPPPEPTGTKTVLVVEDDPSVRKLITLVLREKGFEVIEVADPAEALPTFRRHAGSVDLLLSDIVMPNISGLSVATQVNAEDPNIRVLFVSGYAAETVGAEDVLQVGVNLLPKPFTPEDLLAAVRRTLAAPPGTAHEPPHS